MTLCVRLHAHCDGVLHVRRIIDDLILIVIRIDHLLVLVLLVEVAFLQHIEYYHITDYHCLYRE